MYIDLSDKNIMRMEDVKPGQVVKHCGSFYLVTEDSRNGGIVCANLRTGTTTELYTDTEVVLYSNASLKLL